MTPSPSPPSSPSSATDGVATVAAASPITALPAQNPNPNPVKRGLPPPCWTDDETHALLDSYRDKWYSLRRGNLRAAHWDEVADDVARRSLHLPSANPKTAVQCRHKIEKLRKRYRSERQRSLNHNPTAPPSSPWLFFHKIDHMENPNPNPNPNPHSRSHQNHYSRYQESDDDEEEDEEVEPQFHRRPILSNGGGMKNAIPRAARTSRAIPVGTPTLNPISNNPPSYVKSKKKEEEEEEEEEAGGKGSSALGEMVSALRMLGDGFMRTEQMKMDMAREMERARMEMELKRTEVVLGAQKRIIDSFVKGFHRDKKMKRSSDLS